jgi:iron-sulfur cluster repair protein YtfE (RIC family)
MDTEAVLEKLLAQHDRIRRDLVGCQLLAQRLCAGDPVHLELDIALARLRSDFKEHNRSETEMLLPLLLHESQCRGTRGKLLVERMIEEHVAEHTALCELLDGPPQKVAENMHELVVELDAHMAAEERTFLRPQIHRRHVLGAVAPSDAA